MVAVKNAIQQSYTHRCTITVQKKVLNQHMVTEFIDHVAFEHQPCKLSFSSPISAVSSDSASSIVQRVTLFLSPDISVLSGCKIAVTLNGHTTLYQNSGVPSIFATHQEIALSLFDGWA